MEVVILASILFNTFVTMCTVSGMAVVLASINSKVKA